MDALKILCVLCSLYFANSNANPVRRYDQRQDGDVNIQAHLDKIVLLIIPNKNINILDIKGQGQFDSYEDILPLLGKESAAVNEVRYKLASDESKLKTFSLAAESKEDRKEVVSPKIELLKVEQKSEQKESKGTPAEVRSANPIKKFDSEVTKIVAENQKKTSSLASKIDGRTYQTILLGNNKDRVVSVSNQEGETKKSEKVEPPSINGQNFADKL